MITTFGFFAPTELVIVLVVVLIIFGPGKLPDIGKALGKGISEFKNAASQETEKYSAGVAVADHGVGTSDQPKEKIPME